MIQKIKEKPKMWLVLLISFLAVGGLLLKSSFAVREPIKSVTITSKNVSYEKKGPGSWNVIKSAKWIEKGKAQITFDVDTILKSEERNTDIILVLDVSGSMEGEKLSRVKEDATDLVDTLLSIPENKAALISFESNSRIIENLTNDKDKMIEQINNLTTTGCTNYYQAFKNVEEILKNYQKQENREMIILFLTDGYPNEETPNEIAEYQFLKSEYPDITINGIQYEMGEDILEPIKQISDKQFIADMNSLNNVLFEASLSPIEYDDFTITDYINDEYFNIESIDEVYANIGDVKLEYERNTPKVILNINNFKSGRKARMTINVTLKGKVSEDDLYPTNKKEVIESSIPDNRNEKVTSTETPILSGNYLVVYEANAPEGCSIDNVPAQEKHLVFDRVDISNQEPTCEGYQFKGWEIVTKDVKKLSQDSFIMPGGDVIIRATWTSLTLAKSMNGTVVEKVPPIMKVRNSGAFWNYNTKITSIVFEDCINIPAEIDSDKKWDVSAANNGSVMAYIELDSEGSSTYRLHIQGEEEVIANANSSHLFDYFTKLTTIEGLEYFDTSKVTNMSDMFSRCYELTSLDLSSFDTSNVRYMSNMFSNCDSLTNLDLSQLDTSKVTTMEDMFDSCDKLASLDVSNFDTSNVTNMRAMFYFCKSLTNLDLSSFDTSEVKSMAFMFGNCNSLTSLNVNNFNTSNVTDMQSMFSGCKKLSSLDVSSLDTSKVTNMSSMFGTCNKLANLDVSNFDTSNVTNMSNMFSGCRSLTNLDLSSFDTSKVTNMAYMFGGNAMYYSDCSSLTSLDLSSFDTSNVTTMYGMFYGCSSLSSLDVSGFDTSKVTNMSYMFSGCGSLTSLNLSNFNTSSVTDMSYMFGGNGLYSAGCKSLTSLDLSNFNTSNVKDMSHMFQNCRSLTSLDLSNFNTSKVTNMQEMFGMDYSQSNNLTSLDLSSFDTSNVANMSGLFQNCSSLANLDLSNFNTSKVIDMSHMFYYCYNLTSLDINSFDTSNVTNMEYMFTKCRSLVSLNVSSFDTSNVTSMSTMFTGCSNLKSLDVSHFDTSNVTSMSWMFTGCTSLTSLDLSNFNTSKVTSMAWMFGGNGTNSIGCTGLTSLDLSNFDTSNVTDMSYMFDGCSNLTSLDLSNFDTSKVTNMSYMFSSIKADCLINVKDESMVNWVKARNSSLTNVVVKFT